MHTPNGDFAQTTPVWQIVSHDLSRKSWDLILYLCSCICNPLICLMPSFCYPHLLIMVAKQNLSYFPLHLLHQFATLLLLSPLPIHVALEAVNIDDSLPKPPEISLHHNIGFVAIV